MGTQKRILILRVGSFSFFFLKCFSTPCITNQSISLSLSLSQNTKPKPLYFFALATRPALCTAETLANAFFRKSERFAHAASTALAWFRKMPLLFAPFKVEDGVFAPANSWMSTVLFMLAMPVVVVV